MTALDDDRGRSHAGDPWTSHAAADAVGRRTQRLRVLAELRRAGPEGRTDSELGEALSIRETAAGTRRKELEEVGLCARTDRTRPTKYGNPALVHVATCAGDNGGHDVNLTELEPKRGPDGARRDQRGRYLVVGRDGRLSGYRRATTIAAILGTDFGLVPWSQSRAVLGLLREPPLYRRARKLVKDFGRDPWYEGGKGPFKVLLGEAERAGGRWERADRGTFLHAVLATIISTPGMGPSDLGLDDDPAALAWLDGVLEALARHGVVLDPAGVEALVVNDTLRIAGTSDYLGATVPGYALPLVVDVKTGETADYGSHEWAVQLAIYATAEARYVQGESSSGADDERLDMPELDREHALVIHAPSSGGAVELLVVDIAAGVAALRLALDVEAWRTANVLTPLCADLTPVLEASLAALAADDDRPADGNVGDDPAVLVQYREWLQGRIDVVGRHEFARGDLLRQWPADMPTLRRSDAHTVDELAGLERLLDMVEAAHSIPFGANRPGGDELRVLRLLDSALGAREEV